MTRPVGVLVILLIAGCLDPPETGEGQDEPGDVRLGSFSMDITLTDCIESVLLLPIDPATAQAALPDGWVAADASGLFGLPIETGRVALLLEAIQCDDVASLDGGWAAMDTVILVEPPTFAGAPEPSSVNVYSIGFHQDSWRYMDLVADVEAPSILTGVDLTVEAQLPTPAGLPGAYTTSANVANGTMTWSGTGLAPTDFVATSRSWTATPHGVLYLEFLVDMPIYVGEANECSIDADTAPAIAWSGSCEAGDAFVIAVPPFGAPSTLNFIPLS